jgi:hypothetical protein
LLEDEGYHEFSRHLLEEQGLLRDRNWKLLGTSQKLGIKICDKWWEL